MDTGKLILALILLLLGAAGGYFYGFDVGWEKAIEESNVAVDDVPPQDEQTVVEYKDLIRVTHPLSQQEISSPVTVTGEARGVWYFEASFPIIVVDWDGRIIGEGYAEAQSEWMTEEYVPFIGTVTFDFDTGASNRGAVILQKSNPSDLSEHDDALEVPIFFE